MKKFSIPVKKFLYWLVRNNIKELYTPKTISIIKKEKFDASSSFLEMTTVDTAIEKKFNDIVAQLPNGIWIKPQEVVSVIESMVKTIDVDSISYSPLIQVIKEFKPCKWMKYGQGNIITGRDEEIEKILLTLGKKSKRSVILTGEPGTGKTAIVQAINARLIQRTVPRQLIGCDILTVDIPYIFSKYKDDPVGTIINILEKASEYDKAILFIDEVHQLLGHRMNDILKPYLTEKIRFIGSTTINEYHTIITEDTALERRFTVININEPSIEQTIGMVTGTKTVFEEHHKCSIPDDICRYLVETGSRFLGHRRNPDKSLDLLDIACSIMYEKEIKNVTQPPVKTEEFLKDLEINKKETESLHAIAGDRTLSKHYIDLAISSVTNVSYEEIANSLDYNKVKEEIKKIIVGQDKAVDSISNVVNIFKHIKCDRERPISILLTIGPTGVGKKSTAKLLSKFLFGTTDFFIDYDMSGFKDSFTISELKGSPPGYVGYGKSGSLIKEIRTNPLSVVYFRGIDKAHETIKQYLIDGCRSGKLVDSSEREAKLNNTIIVFSITLSDDEYTRVISSTSSKTMGFSKADHKNVESDSIKKAIISILGQELVNSVDEIIIFNKLSKDDLEKIYEKNVDSFLNLYNVNIDKVKLKEIVLADSVNGHNIISKLSSEVPKSVFRILSKEKDNVEKSKKSIKKAKKSSIPREDSSNDSAGLRQGMECK